MEGRAGTPIAVGMAIVGITAFTILFLELEAQWAIGLLAVATIAALIAFRLTGAAAKLSAAGAAHPRAALGTALGMVLIAAATLHDSHFALLMLATVALYATACLGMTLQFGHAGIVNFAGAAFFGIGCYTTAVLAAHTPIPHLLVIVLAGLAAAMIGSILILPILRTRGHYAALITIAFGILFKTFLEVNDTLGGPQGLRVPAMDAFGWSFNDPIKIGADFEGSFYLNYVFLAVALAALAYLIVVRLEKSWMGLAFDAVRLDETAASVFGIDVARWKILAFTVGNLLAGMAGGVYAMMTGFIAPTNFTFADSLILVSIVILGGLGNAVGVLPATLLLLVLPEKLQVIQEYRFLMYAMLVIAVLLFRPQGLLPRRMRAYFVRDAST
jgi:ABC-type branched-subunit amino acid transport system permease subunit